MHYQPGSFQKRQLKTISLVIGLGVVGIVAILWQSNPELLTGQSQVCRIKQPQTSITKGQALQLLAVKEGVKRSDLLSFMREPYCQLTTIEVRAGTKALRDVYPLDSDPTIWVVLLYEDDRYLGYRFLSAAKYKVQ